MNLKVVFHIDEMEKWEMLLNNVRNFLKEEENADIIVLANGNAVMGYLKNSFEYDDILKLRGQVCFIACNNSIVATNINREELDTRVKIVPSGVVSLALLQKEGYFYIKP